MKRPVWLVAVFGFLGAVAGMGAGAVFEVVQLSQRGVVIFPLSEGLVARIFGASLPFTAIGTVLGVVMARAPRKAP
jgi:tetrahydromethanopterin S-methyltransferase subunit E